VDKNAYQALKTYKVLYWLVETSEGLNVSYEPYDDRYVLESPVGTWIGRKLEDAFNAAYADLFKED
jgi:hypothetical protein